MALPQTGLIGLEAALQPFAGPGLQAGQTLAAQSGALGQPAQQSAFDQFISSPGQQFLQDKSEQALRRNASATGGLGGGNLLQALQQNAIGLAQQDFGNQQNVLGNLASGGLTAARDIGTGRTRAGEQIAGNVAGTSSALANLVNQQGSQLGQTIGTSSGNIANLVSGAGIQQGTSDQQLATLLANLSAGQGSQLVGASGIPQTQGNIGGLGSLASGLGGLFSAFSDIRMKENIVKIGELTSGLNIYKWDWKDSVKHLVGKQINIGVIAQEVEKIIPKAIERHESGYLTVNYEMVH